MSIKYSLLCLWVLFFLTSCKKKEIIEYHNNKNPEIINYYSRTSNLNYVQKGFYRLGDLKYVAHYSGGKLNGDYKEYFETGELMLKREFKNGIAHGYGVEYFKNGLIRSEGEMINGKVPDGEVITYYNNGQIDVIFHMIDEKAEGKWLKYFKNGVIEQEGFYKNDTLIGDFFYFDTTGILTDKLIYRNGEIIN